MNNLSNEIKQRYVKENRIHSVFFEVTHRCICNCEHCYVVKDFDDELSIVEIADMMQQFQKEGVLNLIITGGDPFCRNDLPQILELAHKERFFTDILTTGILIDQPEVNLLRELKIWSVQISILGANPDTHDTIMRHPGAYKRMIKAVKLFCAAGIRVNLSSTIIKQNCKELTAMEEIANNLGVPFYANIIITPRLDGDLSPQQFALKEKELSYIDHRWIIGELVPGEKKNSQTSLTCNAGKTVAGISPNGDIFPCTIFRQKVGNIRYNTLKDIWHDNTDTLLNEIRNLKPEEVATCYTCDLKSICPRCPGIAYLETRDFRMPSPSTCVYARIMARRNKPNSAQK